MTQPPTEPRYPLTYQEALRSLGALLDAAVAGRATLHVRTEGIEIDAPGGFGRQLYSWPNVVALSDARASLRGTLPAVPKPYLTSWESLLRLAGRALDTAGLPRYELHAAVASEAEPTRCYLEVTVEGKRVMGETEVIEQLMEIEVIRRSRDEVDPSIDDCGEGGYLAGTPPQLPGSGTPPGLPWTRGGTPDGDTHRTSGDARGASGP